MPAVRSTKVGSSSARQLSKKAQVKPCNICGKVVSRAADVPRHMKRHDRSAERFSCNWLPACKYKTLQKSNLDTHMRRHTGERPFICLDSDDCIFDSCDPASLLRHRKKFHGYVPNGRRSPSATTLPNSSSPESSGTAWDIPDVYNMDFLCFCTDMEYLDLWEVGLNQHIPSNWFETNLWFSLYNLLSESTTMPF